MRCSRGWRCCLRDGDREDLINQAAIKGICWFWGPSKGIFDQGALTMWKICTYHQFMNGNERTALATALKILNAAGLTLPDNNSMCDVMVGAAKEELSEVEVAEMMRGMLFLGLPGA